jgi:hypothetical protein
MYLETHLSLGGTAEISFIDVMPECESGLGAPLKFTGPVNTITGEILVDAPGIDPFPGRTTDPLFLVVS